MSSEVLASEAAVALSMQTPMDQRELERVHALAALVAGVVWDSPRAGTEPDVHLMRVERDPEGGYRRERIGVLYACDPQTGRDLGVESLRDFVVGAPRMVLRLHAEVMRLRGVVERDRIAYFTGLRQLRDSLAGWRGMAESRGAYAWDDDEYRKEFGRALDELRHQAENLSVRANATSFVDGLFTQRQVGAESTALSLAQLAAASRDLFRAPSPEPLSRAERGRRIGRVHGCLLALGLSSREEESLVAGDQAEVEHARRVLSYVWEGMGWCAREALEYLEALKPVPTGTYLDDVRRSTWERYQGWCLRMLEMFEELFGFPAPRDEAEAAALRLTGQRTALYLAQRLFLLEGMHDAWNRATRYAEGEELSEDDGLADKEMEELAMAANRLEIGMTDLYPGRVRGQAGDPVFLDCPDAEMEIPFGGRIPRGTQGTWMGSQGSKARVDFNGVQVAVPRHWIRHPEPEPAAQAGASS